MENMNNSSNNSLISNVKDLLKDIGAEKDTITSNVKNAINDMVASGDKNSITSNIKELLKYAVDRGAVDIFLITGRPASFKAKQQIEVVSEERLMPDTTDNLIKQIYDLAKRDINIVKERGDDDFSFAVKDVSRFRINTYKQRGSIAAVIRVIPFSLPTAEEYHIPKDILDLGNTKRGLVLVTGSSASGKTTTLTCILDEINKTSPSHIITLEDPIEFLHAHKQSIVSQREISLDTGSYPVALRAALRQSPDVILIGELRDAEAINISLTAAETGHLVLSALHTLGAANSIDRLVDTFPPNQQDQIRMQLSMVLQTVVCQQLVLTKTGEILPVFEVMHCNNAIRTLIREGRTHQINHIIQSSSAEGMISMDNSLANLYKEGKIDKETALKHSLVPAYLLRQIGEEPKTTGLRR